MHGEVGASDDLCSDCGAKGTGGAGSGVEIVGADAGRRSGGVRAIEP